MRNAANRPAWEVSRIFVPPKGAPAFGDRVRGGREFMGEESRQLKAIRAVSVRSRDHIRVARAQLSAHHDR